MGKLTDLPTELVIRILFNTDVVAVLRCRQVSRLMNKLVTESALLQYKIELVANGMIDGPSGIRGMEAASSRLEALRAYAYAWDTLQPRKKTVIKGHLGDTSLYELCGGVWAGASKTAGRPLTAVRLPSIVRDVEMSTWKVPLTDKGRIADFGMDPQQDLLVLINYSQNGFDFRINLRSLKNGHPHPRARVSVLAPDFHAHPLRCSFTVQVMGDLLGILFEADLDVNMSTLLNIWDWTTGKRIFEQECSSGSRLIRSFAFLSEKLLVAAAYCLLEDEDEPPSLDVYHLGREEDDRSTRIRSFYFPELSWGTEIQRLMIRSDPALTVTSDPDHPYPFVLDPMHRLYIITMVLEYETSNGAMFRLAYHFLVPLMTIIKEIPRKFGGSSDKMEFEDDLSWDEWGPAGSRLLGSEDRPHSYLCYVHGMRFVLVPNQLYEDGIGVQGRRVTVFDLSPYAVKRVLLGVSPQHEGTAVDVLSEQRNLNMRGHRAFADGLEFYMPAVRRQTEEVHVVNSAMMDADNIILIKPSYEATHEHEMEIWTM